MKNTKKILVVEDNETFRELLVFFLTSEGYNTVEAPNGEIAYEIFIKESPDLVISDILMPVCNGIEFIKRVLASPRPVPLALVSGYTDKEDLSELKKSPYWIGFFEKPFDESMLLDKIKHALL